ncbi:Alanine--tRNA ligase [Orbilia brochopaga]|uniref:Alanine--tRNA ligase n=1 Tax=Orbilia brochopaga TaxID=3140254 RepID=A0AAV9U0A4_9PEZI
MTVALAACLRVRLAEVAADKPAIVAAAHHCARPTVVRPAFHCLRRRRISGQPPHRRSSFVDRSCEGTQTLAASDWQTTSATQTTQPARTVTDCSAAVAQPPPPQLQSPSRFPHRHHLSLPFRPHAPPSSSYHSSSSRRTERLHPTTTSTLSASIITTARYRLPAKFSSLHRNPDLDGPLRHPSASAYPIVRSAFERILPILRSSILHLLNSIPLSRTIGRNLSKMASSTSSTPSKPVSQETPPPEKWPASKVRDTFLKYFQNEAHVLVPSSPCVPKNDKSLLFANAGMNQFKPIFQGTVGPESQFGKLRRACNTQKCIRAGGKHNDLEDVGQDSYHHTFFEMLGNWSFGDYFKAEAIRLSWNLLTKVYGLDPKRLYVTYFEGDKASGLEPDLETKELWRKIGVPDDHILPGNIKDNFWEMGDIGPCGPCTEIHYDRIGGGRNAAHLVNMDDPNVLEIWNNVFIQFNREADRSLRSLPSKHVDTGMGFERLVSILQDKSSNYDTDVFTPIFQKIQEVTKARPYAGKFGKEDVDQVDTAYRVVADHLRTLAFGIADGEPPSNDGRGYVLRRITRRGARYARKKLNAEIGSFFSKLLPTLVEQLSPIFPELLDRQAVIKAELDKEEVSFARTLDKGEKLFDEHAKVALAGNKILSGKDVWKLYDTFGFPIDLTRLMAGEIGLKIDEVGLEKCRQAARDKSKATNKGEGGEAVLALDVHNLGELEKEKVPRTLDNDKFKWGKDAITQATVLKVIVLEKGFVETTKDVTPKDQVGVLLDKTCMYAEQGGQIYDTGTISVPGQVQFDVTSVQSYGGYILHVGKMKKGILTPGSKVTVEYDETRRAPIRINHTATHILNFALREVLGDGVHQKGSLVDPEKTRFDFSNDVPVTPEQCKKIEDISNAYVQQNLIVYAQDVGLAIAEGIEGVRAVFGEKYPDPVRVVSIGIDVEEILRDKKNPDWRKLSIEFCGGTHIKQTGDIKDLVIIEESGIGKGIRRIVAVTDKDAAKVRSLDKDFMKQMDALDKTPLGPVKEELARGLSGSLNKAVLSCFEKAKLRDELARINKIIAEDGKERLREDIKNVEESLIKAFGGQNLGTRVAVVTLKPGGSAKTVSEAIKIVQKSYKDKAVYYFVPPVESGPGAKVAHGCYVPERAVKSGHPAESITKQVSEVIGGGAGASKDGKTSLGSGTQPDKLNEAIKTANELLGSLVI